MVASKKYEQRLVLFLDFLGFREIIQRTEKEPDLLSKVLGAMKRVGEISADDRKFHHSQQVTQFSDCIVVSYKVEEESAVFWLLNEISYCVVELAYSGFLLRGALTIGDLYHTSEHVVGPGLVTAYELESNLAIYPRIIVDEKVFGVARNAKSEIHTADEELDYVQKFLKKDDDGWFYYDYVSFESVVETTGCEMDEYPDYIFELGQTIKRGLKHKRADVLNKYLWLYRQYIREIERVTNIPEGDYRRVQYEEFVEAFEAIPKFCTLAMKASKLASGKVD